MASGWLTTAMALRSLEDQDLSRASNVLVTMVVALPRPARGAPAAGCCRNRRRAYHHALSSPFRLHQLIERREPAKRYRNPFVDESASRHGETVCEGVAQQLHRPLSLSEERLQLGAACFSRCRPASDCATAESRRLASFAGHAVAHATRQSRPPGRGMRNNCQVVP